jgi:hypothetical protein
VKKNVKAATAGAVGVETAANVVVTATAGVVARERVVKAARAAKLGKVEAAATVQTHARRARPAKPAMGAAVVTDDGPKALQEPQPSARPRTAHRAATALIVLTVASAAKAVAVRAAIARPHRAARKCVRPATPRRCRPSLTPRRLPKVRPRPTVNVMVAVAAGAVAAAAVRAEPKKASMVN